MERGYFDAPIQARAMSEYQTIVFGYTKTAKEIGKILQQREIPFLMVQNNQDDFKTAKMDGFEPHFIDLMEDESLKQLGIQKTLHTLYLFHKESSTNLFITIAARSLDPKLDIITLCENPGEKQKMKLAGANRAISPYEIGAHRVCRILEHPNIIDVIDSALYEHSDFGIFEINVAHTSPLSQKMSKDLDLSNEYNLILIGIKDKEISDDFIFSSAGINHKIDGGDILVVIGHKKDVQRFIKEMI